MPKMTMDHLKSTKKPTTKSVYITQNDELAEEFEAAVAALEALRQRYNIVPDEILLKELHRLEDEIEGKRKELLKPANSIKFIFKSIGPRKYAKLQEDNPPTQEQKDRLSEMGKDPDMLAYDAEGFSAKLVAACSVEPELTFEFVRDEIQNSEDGSWSQGDFNKLYSGCVEANVNQRDINLGKEFRKTKASAKS